MFTHMIVAPDGMILDMGTKESMEQILKGGKFMDGLDGVGPIWVTIPYGSKIQERSR